MSIRIYIGNLPQGFNPKEFDKLLKTVSDSIRFKAVLDKETKESRGFGFATANNEENANLLIQKLNGFEFNGSKLRVELSEKKDSASNKKNGGKLNKNISQLDEFDRFKLHQELEMFLPSFIFYLPENLRLDWLHRWRDNDDKLFHPSNLLNGDVIKKNLKIKDGPLLGELLHYLSKELAYKRLNNFDEAIYKA